MSKILFIILLSLLFVSCAKDETEEQDNETSDANLTPQEIFSTSVLIDNLNDSEDENLTDYLENDFYVNFKDKYKGASFNQISGSLWLVTLDEPGQKNYLLQKFIDLKSDDIYFRLNETSLTAEDLLKIKTNETKPNKTQKSE